MKLSSSNIFSTKKEKSEETKTQPEQPLLNALISGNEEAFEKIYKTYFSHLRNYSLSITQDSEISCDIVQSIFVSIWENRKKLNPNRSLRNYLLCCAHNNSLRYLKTVSLHKKHQANVKREKEQEELENVIVYQENTTSNTVYALLDKLPQRSRQVTFMSRIEEKKSADIAKELNISVRTVETILYQSMKKLKDLTKD